jgi:hypothetical protein
MAMKIAIFDLGYVVSITAAFMWMEYVKHVCWELRA